MRCRLGMNIRRRDCKRDGQTEEREKGSKESGQTEERQKGRTQWTLKEV